MKLLMMKIYNEHSGYDWEEDTVICGSEDEDTLTSIMEELNAEVDNERKQKDRYLWYYEKYDINLIYNCSFYITKLKVF